MYVRVMLGSKRLMGVPADKASINRKIAKFSLPKTKPTIPVSNHTYYPKYATTVTAPLATSTTQHQYDDVLTAVPGNCGCGPLCFAFSCPNNPFRGYFSRKGRRYSTFATPVVAGGSFNQFGSKRHFSTRISRDDETDKERTKNTSAFVVGSPSTGGSGILAKENALTPLQSYFREVNLTTGKFLGLTAVTGAGTVGTTFALSSVVPPDTLMSLGAVGLIGSFAGSLYHAWQLGKEKPEAERLRHAYWMHGLMGVSIAPSLFMFSQFIPHALITTGALVAGPITAAYRMPKGSMLPYGSALYTGLWGLIGVGVTSIFAPIIGFPGLGMMMHNVDLYGGVLLFTVYNAYDTHVLIDDFEKGKKDVIGHSANYSLNAINIFIRMLEIFAKMNKKN
ncbi:hypothetical protein YASMINEVIRUS_1192 [Yasminevirus sp. GU-2018]|uniref:Growth hormone-inducible transmembrane protein n=1 Tax=Yasminevirus sp. GU-2018 TaxID=2420051 RepID=A0A5K0UAM9_9VIRU|nr:hypothetical protein YASMINEVIRUS_1192 [Yasminevirus sp. GU-2018]